MWPASTTRSARPRDVRATTVLPSRVTVEVRQARTARPRRHPRAAARPRLTDSMSHTAAVRVVTSEVRSSEGAVDGIPAHPSDPAVAPRPVPGGARAPTAATVGWTHDAHRLGPRPAHPHRRGDRARRVVPGTGARGARRRGRDLGPRGPRGPRRPGRRARRASRGPPRHGRPRRPAGRHRRRLAAAAPALAPARALPTPSTSTACSGCSPTSCGPPRARAPSTASS